MAPPKAKGQKMGLGEFLTDSSLGSWADEMEDVPVPCGRSGYGGERTFSSGGGYGSGGYSERGGYSVREQLPLPTKPPYTVHLGNMSFDATEGDIQDFFSGCSVTSVRIVEDKLDRKPKGFGYAEFATLDGLKKALEYNNTQFQGRNIRVNVAEPQKDRVESRDFGDWSRKGPLPDIGGQRRVSERGGFGSRGFDNVSEAGSDRGSRRPYEQDSGRDLRNIPGNWERKGPLTPTIPNGSAARSTDRPSSHDGPRDRKNSPAWGEGRSQDGSRPPRREFSDRPPIDRAPTAPEMDNQWRSKMRPDPPVAPPAKSPILQEKDLSAPPSPAAPASIPVTRPRLNLQKRTVSQTETSPALASATSDTKASPFGAARPIDTFAKDREIEEKRELALRQKKETDEKAREDKRLAEEKIREGKRSAKEAEKAERNDTPATPKEKPNGQSKEKENGYETPQPGKNYEILRRATNDESSLAEEEVDDEGESGLVTEDKAVKPQEIVQNIPSKEPVNGGPKDGSESQQPQVSSEPTADALEDGGWSTVSKPRNNRKGGNSGARAIAS